MGRPTKLEPLRKALQVPCVGLFIADDVGLGKTIEAGWLVREPWRANQVNDHLQRLVADGFFTPI
jgi:hypothetical protein